VNGTLRNAPLFGDAGTSFTATVCLARLSRVAALSRSHDRRVLKPAEEATMKMLLLATVIAFAPFMLPAHASNLTGDALALACSANVPDLKKDKNTEKYADFCNTYINGRDDARFAFLQGTTTYCPPTITVKETSVIFFDYLATHSEARKLPAAEALMVALKDKWPCH
jgi:hypothetical protein